MPHREQRVYELSEEGAIGSGKSVLMLEDDEDFADTLRTFLENNEFQVIRVPSGVEGLKHIMAVDFHVILCDLVMPNLPGDMFYLAVERIKPQLCKRFIFMTGHGADPKWDAFIRKVRGLVLFKPFPLHDLLAAIHNVLQKQ